MNMRKTKKYITVQEAATMLNLSSNTIRRLLMKEEFEGKRFGRQIRISRSSFDEYIKKCGI